MNWMRFFMAAYCCSCLACASSKSRAVSSISFSFSLIIVLYCAMFSCMSASCPSSCCTKAVKSFFDCSSSFFSFSTSVRLLFKPETCSFAFSISRSFSRILSLVTACTEGPGMAQESTSARHSVTPAIFFNFFRMRVFKLYPLPVLVLDS